MRRVEWLLLLLFVFAIPWEYSLELGEGLGNVGRFVGLLALLAAIPAVLQSGRMRSLGVCRDARRLANAASRLGCGLMVAGNPHFGQLQFGAGD